MVVCYCDISAHGRNTSDSLLHELENDNHAQTTGNTGAHHLNRPPEAAPSDPHVANMPSITRARGTVSPEKQRSTQLMATDRDFRVPISASCCSARQFLMRSLCSSARCFVRYCFNSW